MESLSGTTALVTGAAGGIGLAIAQALLAEGVRVALADIDRAELDRVVPPLGARAMPMVLDVTDRIAWADARSTVEATFGPVDILVNNAGMGPDGHPLAEMDPANWDRIVALNLTGVFNGVHCFATGMAARRRGHIVNVASMAGLRPIPRLGGYSATKFAVVGMSESLRAEMAEHDVGVSVMCPGFIRTRLAETTARAGIKRATLPQADSQAPLDPALIGALAVEGIRANMPLIVSHGEYRAFVAKRARAIDDAFEGVPIRG